MTMKNKGCNIYRVLDWYWMAVILAQLFLGLSRVVIYIYSRQFRKIWILVNSEISFSLHIFEKRKIFGYEILFAKIIFLSLL